MEDNNTSGEEPLSPTSIEQLANFIQRASMLLLEIQDAITIDKLFNLDQVKDLVLKFTKESDYPTLCISKFYVSNNQKCPEYLQTTSISLESSEKETIWLNVSLEVNYLGDGSQGVVFTKRKPENFTNQLGVTKSISSLLQISEVGDVNGSPPDSLLQFLYSAFEPYFYSYARSKYNYNREDSDSKIGIPSVFSSLNELYSALSNWRQNTAIPELNLMKHVHPIIKDLVAKQESIDSLGDKLNDHTFLNELQHGIKECVKDIRQITEHRDAPFRTIMEGLSYWGGLEKALSNIDAQLKAEEFSATLKILQKTRRFHAAMSLTADTSINSSLEQARLFHGVLKDLPIQELLAAKDVEEITDVIEQILIQAKKKSKELPIDFSVHLIQAVSHDLAEQLNKVLGTRNLLNLPYEQFDKATAGCDTLFSIVGQHMKQFTAIYYSKKSKYSNKSAPKLNLEHNPLRDRIQELRKFRRQHEELRLVVERVLPPFNNSSSNINALEEINNAYEDIKNIEKRILDTSKEGNEVWEAALKTYNSRIDRVEIHITNNLRDKLGTAKNASEMFRIFAKFNPLFCRPKIQSAIHEYQEQLIDKVKDDIKKLREKFTERSQSPDARYMTDIWDLPTVSGFVIWALQIRRQLDLYMKRVDAVFGKGWERLIALRRPNKSWMLDENLADFMGIPFSKLQSQVNQGGLSDFKPEVQGTALALAFLENVFKEFENEYNIHAKESKTFLHAEEKKASNVTNSDTLSIAKNLLTQLGVGLQHVEGQKIRSEAELFKNKLNENIEQKISDWTKDVTECIKKWGIFEITGTRAKAKGNIFEIRQKEGEDHLELEVNFHPGIETLMKEMRNLTWLNMLNRLGETIISTATTATEIHPHAVSLIESVNTFKKASERLSPDIYQLMANPINQIHRKLRDGFNLTWDKGQNETYSKDLSELTRDFNEKVTNLIHKNEQIHRAMDSLKTSPLRQENFREILGRIQGFIDELDLASYSNLKNWVKNIDKEIEDILVDRLKETLSLWIEEFNNMGNSESTPKDRGSAQNSPGFGEDFELKQRKALLANLNMAPFQIELQLHNRTMHVEPPLEKARVHWLGRLHSCISWICDLNRIQSSRYNQANIQESHGSKDTYRTLLGKLPQGMLRSAYESVEEKIGSVGEYLLTWLQYQSLWDMELNSIYEQLGNDASMWLELIECVKSARSVIDNSDSSKSFGAIIIDYQKVQNKVNMKYDDTLRELLTSFREKLSSSSHEFYENISSYRHKLEAANFEANLGDAVSFLNLLQSIKKYYHIWERQVKSFKAGQDILQKHRVRLPQDWIDADNIEGEWSAFNEILHRRNEAMAKIRKDLVNKLMEDDQNMEEKLEKYAQDWKDEKPLDGNIKVDKALAILNNFESNLNDISSEIQRIHKAKEALDLDIREVDRLDPYIEELNDFKEVWNALRSVWDSIKNLRDAPFNSITHQMLRSRLDEILNSIKQLPASMRQFAAVEYAKRTVKGYLSVNLMIHDLRSDAMKDRHWKELMKRLGVRWTLSELTLGQVWDADIKKNEGIFKEVIRTAMGEQALENFFEQITDYWSSFQLEMVDYKHKCHLIRGWDDLFNKVGEHLNSLSAMRMSPFFKVFEDQCSAWEDKLNRIRVIFDIWVDVQRRWVYLEGVFMGNADIKHQLPRESQRFSTLDKEFVTLMRDVYKNRAILDVLSFKNLQKTLEKISNLLTNIQKALGEYLEKQRAAFPRFYFVGDEDLLEIIGQSTDPRQVLKHLKKMFAGIGTLMMNEEASEVLGMASKEGEEIEFRNKISLSNSPKVNEWLSSVEYEMRHTLASILSNSIDTLEALYKAESFNQEEYLEWIQQTPAQLVVLTSQIVWTHLVDSVLKRLANKTGTNSTVSLEDILNKIMNILEILADFVLTEEDPRTRKKQEYLITELVHQRDVLRQLIKENVMSPRHFSWLYYMRFYWNGEEQDLLKRLEIETANAQFYYGYEYLGVQDRLVQTPLTDRAYLTLTQALNARLGGNPFGPAGTGKTETVKALGAQLGRFVLVFNCDENFDFKAMGRIFVGLCQCGAWGCFDEFNRLEERILSAVSQQIQTIQEALRDRTHEIELIGREVKVNFDTGIFVTMNPGYAGRSNLPDNLKQLFRAMAMVKPDREMIAQVMLFSQGFKTAEELASKVVPFFQLCKDQLSQQSHYDFGLRALKSVLVNSGNLKRQAINEQEATHKEITEAERKLLIRSISETVIPKLVGEDIPLFKSLLQDVFPGTKIQPAALEQLREKVRQVCKERFYVFNDQWVEKMIQLYQIQSLQHGIMLVGPSGCGKTSAWKVLLEALHYIDGVEGQAYLIDPKAIAKDELYGSLDKTTREWQDGIFTHTLRKIIDNVRGESSKRHWIIFDGDVDPEWVENLNSVLDDNKLLTLPNGERLSLPDNVRIMFEVENLKYATLATVSRCGMVWFSEEVNSLSMMFDNYLSRLRSVPVTTSDDEYMAASAAAKSVGVESEESNISKEDAQTLEIQKQCVKLIEPFFASGELVTRTIEFATELGHVMDFTRLRVLTSIFSILNYGIIKIMDYNGSHPYFPMDRDHMQHFITKHLVFSLIWGLGGSMNIKDRVELGRFISSISTISMPDGELINYQVNIETGEWLPWSDSVPTIEVETQKCESVNEVIPTIDTVRHVEVLKSWLSQHKPLLLCGPPGSGKTMTLTSVLNQLPDYDVVFLNFSSATQPGMILKTFEQYCEFVSTQEGTVMRPVQSGKWLVVFCDEINLPAADKYGTQRVITFIRQLVEQGGFWRAKDLNWVKIERIQFVGACNPPTDPGRTPLTHRFLRHAPLLLVDFPAEESLHQIYGTFSRALLRPHAHLKNYSESLTQSLVDIYRENQDHFSADMQPHYIYSPRELSRWIRALHEALRPQTISFSPEEFVRLVAHEGLRLFQDRLVYDEERQWEDETIDRVLTQNFPSVDRSCLERPILFSNWLTKDYVSVDKEELRTYTQARLKSFAEEELEVQLVVFDAVLDHVLRIDRVLRQPLGHLLLVGVSGSGKTVLSRFVAWMIGLSVFQIKAHRKYTLEDFEEDLRTVMKRAGCKDERICFIFDESNILDSSFLEYMNALLASGEVPGLFEGDDYTSLMHSIKEAIPQNLILDSEDEMYRWFISRVQRNLHVIFTMNPAGTDFEDRSATSPALFNRCVIDWFGEWSESALMQVADEFTRNMDLQGVLSDTDQDMDIHNAVTNSIVSFHNIVKMATDRLAKRQGPKNFLTPRQYLDFIQQFKGLYAEKRSDLQEQQLHLNQGLKKLRETEEEVAEMKISLTQKEEELREKDKQANEKLKEMVKDQQEAEDKKKESEKIQEQLEEQSKDIGERKGKAQEELSEALPALEEAQQAVKKIRKRDLDEIRQLRNPPAPVKKTLEAVSIVVFKAKSTEWKEISRLMRRDDFISSVATFDPQAMTRKARQKAKEYLDDPGLEFDTVYRASRAAGPLIKWLKSQIYYAEILNSIEPLQKEVDSLEEKYQELQSQSEDINGTISELEERIAVYKDEYAGLIRETETIKSDMEKVKSKVERSTSLLQSLSEERGRWEFQSTNFETQMSTVVGDVLLSSAFLAYIGFFDEHFRHRVILPKWQDQLNSWNVKFKEDLSLIEYLSIPDERLEWDSNKLPNDDLCIENAIMLHRFNRYPLVIDPSGQATEFIMNQFRDKNITKTSFLDDAFMKHLESALRFGYPLLVQDVENIDPILNPILNKEVRRSGGRNLIRLGDQDIDFSPSFSLYMTTRDPTFQFAPDVCSRVTFVNFTVTPASLQSQCLNQIIKSESPEIDQKRSDMLKLQGEYKVRLRSLEQKLLNAISEAQVNILEDEHIIGTLEKLKTEASEVTQKMKETESVMTEIQEATDKYSPLSSSCSKIYFSLVNLSDIHFLYYFALQFFFDMVHDVLHKNKRLEGVRDPEERYSIIFRDIFTIAFERTSRSLLHEDQLAFALRLAQIKLTTQNNELDLDDVDFLLKAAGKAGDNESKFLEMMPEGVKLTNSQTQLANELSSLPAFKNVLSHISSNQNEWKEFMQHSSAHTKVPGCFSIDSDKKEHKLFRSLLALKVFRPDALAAGASEFVKTVFDDSFFHLPELDLNKIVKEETDSYTPLMLCSMPGYDASGYIEDLAVENSKQYRSIAMGSAEGFEQADQAITQATKSGIWVLLKNVHLSPNWLSSLEKFLHGLQLERKTNSNFRLFMTAEVHPKLPSNLVRRAHVFVFEPPPGVKANLSHTFTTSLSSAQRVDKPPAERSRLHLIASWFHAVAQERLRYAPVGWSKTYEFNESDLKYALYTIDTWVSIAAKDRDNINPEQLPWHAIITLLGESIYGGRVDNDFDHKLLKSFLKSFFDPKAYDEAFKLFSSPNDSLTVPEGTKRQHFIEWIDQLPERETPEWLGLPNNVSLMLRTKEGTQTTNKMLKIQSLDENETAFETSTDSKEEFTGPSWARAVIPLIHNWMEILPEEMKHKAMGELSHPLARFYSREATLGINLLSNVRRDLQKLLEISSGQTKITNYFRSLVTSLTKGLVPSAWRQFKFLETISLNEWMLDLSKRMEQLSSIIEAVRNKDYMQSGVWMGGLFAPGAFITATRQAVAQAHQWSLEKLELEVEIGEDRVIDDQSFIINGLTLVSADYRDGALRLTEDLTTHLPATRLRWVKKGEKQTNDSQIELPLYLNSNRQEVMATITLSTDENLPPYLWYQRGTAILAWSRE
eukprot:gb/GECH01012464.1/.p1 GENE.gb/GECH01012464.1/~~gb/GECH01012464.1/.p1  ORF type:complete len:4713 (+),score=1227.40 gb/GECH01012464.1/:1-14139(+)